MKIFGQRFCAACLICVTTGFIAFDAQPATAPLDEWHIRYENPAPPFPDVGSLRDVVFGNDLFVVVTTRGEIVTTPNPNGGPWTIRREPQSNPLTSITFGDGRFVAVGSAGTVLTSTDGFVWNGQSGAEGTDLTGVTYGNGAFVAVGRSGIFRSPDGSSWTRALDSVNLDAVTYGNNMFMAVGRGVILSSPNGIDWDRQPRESFFPFNIGYGNGVFVIVGASGMIMSSEDGSEWRISPPDNSSTAPVLNDVLFFGGSFFIVGIARNEARGVILTSEDGVTWTSRITSSASPLMGAAAGNGRAVIVGGGLWGATELPNVVVTSPDGVVWRDQTLETTLSGVTFDAGKFVAVGNNGLVLTSTDGTTWQMSETPTGAHLSAVAISGQVHVAVGQQGTILRSTDGLTWVQSNSGVAGDLRAVVFAKGMFFVVGGNAPPSFGGAAGSVILSSSDGIQWTIHENGSAGPLYDIAFGNDWLVSVGGYAPSGQPSSSRRVVSQDGVEWTGKSELFGDVLQAVAYGDGRFLAAGQHTTVPQISTNGFDWTPSTLSLNTQPFHDLEYGASTFVAPGRNGRVRISADGTNWVTKATSSSRHLRAVAYGNGTFVAVGDGGTIVQSGVLVPNGAPPVITSPPDGQTAMVSTAPILSVSANSFGPMRFQWQLDGRVIPGATDSWLVLDQVRFSDAGVYTVLVSNSAGSVTSHPALVSIRPGEPGRADLSFNAVVQSTNFPVPTERGFGSVYDMIVQPDRKIVIAGEFDQIAGVDRVRLARLHADGTVDASFQPSSGPNGVVAAIGQQSAGKIIAGGRFSNVGGVSRDSLARFNLDGSLDESFFADGSFAGSGFNLNPGIEPGPNSVVASVIVQPDNRILVAGGFRGVNGQPAGGLVRLDEHGNIDPTFRASPGADGVIWSIELLRDNRVLVAGDFTSLHGIHRRRVAVLSPDGAVDSTFDPGQTAAGSVYCARAQPDGKIVLAGEFPRISGAPEAVLRVNADGSRDTSFEADSLIMAPAFTLELQPDGRVLVGNVAVEGVRRHSGVGIHRLESSGKRDESFVATPGIGGGPLVGNPRFGGGNRSAVRAIAFADGFSILIGGSFTTVQGQSLNYLAKLFARPQGPPILAATLRDGKFEVAVPTVQGTAYVLEYKASLLDPEWKSLPNVRGDGTVKWINDDSADAFKRFYQLRIPDPARRSVEQMP